MNDEIQQTRLDLEDNKIESGYQVEKYIMYTSLTVLFERFFTNVKLLYKGYLFLLWLLSRQNFKSD